MCINYYLLTIFSNLSLKEFVYNSFYLEKLHITVRYVSPIAQAVKCLATAWTTGRSKFDPRQRRKDSSSSLRVQIGSGAHPASCTMGTGGPFPGTKARPGRDADRSPNLVQSSRMSRSYICSPPKRLHGFIIF
jgi:hypothetical protein